MRSVAALLNPLAEWPADPEERGRDEQQPGNEAEKSGLTGVQQNERADCATDSTGDHYGD